MTHDQHKQAPISLPLFDELRGQRVVLRPLHESDVQPYYEAIEESREHLRPWLSLADRYQSEADVLPFMRQSMADWLVRKDMRLHIWDALSERFLGGCGIHPQDWEIRSFELGYWLRASATGQGYVSEAIQLLVNYLFDTLQAQRVTIRCDEDNHASAAVPRRLGFVYEGTTRNALTGPNGKLINVMIFSLIPSDRQ
ncbi:MAG TPA: GNAT family N-acetyltransferase [Ktedonobacteraceae bacterium]|jgi:RimJ/RimL family protein N-acetyltransferase